jgi:hypothetical protein
LILINPYSLTLVVCVCPKPGPRFPSFTSWSFLCFPDEYCFIGYQLIVDSSWVFLGYQYIVDSSCFLGYQYIVDSSFSWVPVYCRQFLGVFFGVPVYCRQFLFLGSSLLSTVPVFGVPIYCRQFLFLSTSLLLPVLVLTGVNK